MKGFVRSDSGSALISALVIVAIASITNASLGGLYLICLGVFLVWHRLTFGPFRPPSWRAIRRLWS